MPQDLRHRAPSGHATASLQIQPACQCAVACARCEQRTAQDRTSMKPACVSPFGCRHRSLNARAAWRKTHPPEDVCESHQGQATSNFRAVARVRRQRPPAGTYLLQDGGISAYHASGVGRMGGKLPIVTLVFAGMQTLCTSLCSCTDLTRDVGSQNLAHIACIWD